MSSILASDQLAQLTFPWESDTAHVASEPEAALASQSDAWGGHYPLRFPGCGHCRSQGMQSGRHFRAYSLAARLRWRGVAQDWCLCAFVKD